jgi:hypothetical protein
MSDATRRRQRALDNEFGRRFNVPQSQAVSKFSTLGGEQASIVACWQQPVTGRYITK